MSNKTKKIMLNFGVITGEQKRILECYVDSRLFIQRKSYDEYTITQESIELSVDLDDLMIIAEVLEVRVEENYISISD